MFHDYGKCAELLDSTNRQRLRNPAINIPKSRDDRTPSLVSFVGQTGAGKSTIIKLLIDFYSVRARQFPSPVVGISGASVPTSEDVHLYLDPFSAFTHAPLLYADCEGLQGGVREPVGAKYKKRRNRASEASSSHTSVPTTCYRSQRELLWANTIETKARQFTVENLYPRLLYTFSDVIVFVLENSRYVTKLSNTDMFRI
jgi:hypothetical protein